MDNNKPDKTYIYEKANGIRYAREFCGDPSSRFPVGVDPDTRDVIAELKESRLWGDIKRAAKTNPALQEALDRVKIIYELSKQDGQK